MNVLMTPLGQLCLPRLRIYLSIFSSHHATHLRSKRNLTESNASIFVLMMMTCEDTLKNGSLVRVGWQDTLKRTQASGTILSTRLLIAPKGCKGSSCSYLQCV